MDAMFHNVKASREIDTISFQERKDSRDDNDAMYVTLANEHSPEHLEKKSGDIEEYESLCTNKTMPVPQFLHSSPFESELEPIVVTEDGLIFSAEQSNIIMNNDGTMCLQKDDVLYEIEGIMDYQAWNGLVATPAANQFPKSVQESTDQAENKPIVCNGVGNGYYHSCERPILSEDQSNPTNDYNAAHRTTLQDHGQSSANSVISFHRSERELPNRIPAHKYAHQCILCAKSFASRMNLVRHNRIHTGDKPFQCDQCKKCFTQKHHLLRHILCHKGEKPFKCECCGKCFPRKSYLVIHKRSHTGEKPYSCKVCKKSFGDIGILASHKRIHTGEKPYQCDTCGKCFRQAAHLKTHKRTHTDEKP